MRSPLFFFKYTVSFCKRINDNRSINHKQENCFLLLINANVSSSRFLLVAVLEASFPHTTTYIYVLHKTYQVTFILSELG